MGGLPCEDALLPRRRRSGRWPWMGPSARESRSRYAARRWNAMSLLQDGTGCCRTQRRWRPAPPKSLDSRVARPVPASLEWWADGYAYLSHAESRGGGRARRWVEYLHLSLSIEPRPLLSLRGVGVGLLRRVQDLATGSRPDGRGAGPRRDGGRAQRHRRFPHSRVGACSPMELLHPAVASARCRRL